MAALLTLRLLVFYLLCTSITEGDGGTLEVNPTYAVVKNGDPILMHCSAAGRKIESCLIKLPGNEKSNIVRPNQSGDLQYEGEGFDKGQCGFRIEHANESHNGVFVCSTIVSDENFESVGRMTVVVARTPTHPELKLYPGSEANHYKEGEIIHATCFVKNSRPATNFTWYLGDDVVNDGLSKPYITSTKDSLQSTEQNITRTVMSSDNGKDLRCVADHIGLTEQNREASKPLSVFFGPKSSQQEFEQFGMVEGEEGQVRILIEANPQPSFIWNVAGDAILEGDRLDRFEVLRTTKQEIGDYWETVLVISGLTKEDVSKEYKVEASNKYGQQSFIVKISTNPEPKVLSIGGRTIIVVLVGTLLALVVVCAILFARARGRWCFAGHVAPRLAGESSDTESADHHTTSDSRKKLSFISVFKKNNNKVLTNVGEENKDVAEEDDEEKIDTRLERVEDDSSVNALAIQPASQTNETDGEGEGVVYAELDLQARRVPGPTVVRGDDDKTEYAEIVHTKPQPK